MIGSLNDGIIIIDGFEISPSTKITEVINYFPNEEIKIFANGESVRFIKPVMLGNKNFYVRLASANSLITSVNLVVFDPALNEWDVEPNADLHGEWLCEQLGYPQGLLDENLFNWGKIIQWEDFRSRQTQINILYNN
ncbi:hypothetical protein [Fictibacillus sp. 26RED30]|uniref:hypothetical protein n=1 Tax=Fictibacillus sp. 26RED30 TaxID=2745877 RepID=UPI0018CCB757|nr:hypothetical protein [Fictibacillus sp. 26RED30]MBH0162764.1 hypothetical protein [Fictibacillus sp. 26RED30]